ncbi:hypothetical protein [Stenotrophomonas sp.]|uniref:hypothetical protein n=1 Tax=Stenotrophomonas sp. TaxID=69392 RepID=UPI0028B07967|nr:hypothetical protein [Stenotrophomonas sp.]
MAAAGELTTTYIPWKWAQGLLALRQAECPWFVTTMSRSIAKNFQSGAGLSIACIAMILIEMFAFIGFVFTLRPLFD